MTNVLFVCTGNSCRSQMAEGWLGALGGGRFGADSAGIEVHGRNPLAIAVMGGPCGYRVRPCGRELPAIAARHPQGDWPLEDPARAQGAEAEVMNAFRASRDDIRDRIQALITELVEQTNRTGAET